MPDRSPYRFKLVVPILIGLLLFFFAPTHLQAQDEDSTTVVVEPPVESYDEDDDYNTADQELPPELRNVPDSTVSRLKKDKAFAYANDDEFLEKEKLTVEDDDDSAWEGGYRFFSSTGAQVLMYVLLAAFFIFVIYRIIVVNNLYFISSKKKLIHDDDGGEEEITAENIDDKIRGAAGAGDYRTAVRYMYIKGLRLLSDKGWIRMHAQATNHDYVYQVSRYPVAADFNFLTRVYDYVWYGEFAVNDEQYARLQSDFQNFYRAVK